MTEKWHKCLDENKVVGAVLWISQKLLIAYLRIYSLQNCMHAYDIFVILSTDDMHNFADNNMITAVSETIQDLRSALQNKTERALK